MSKEFQRIKERNDVKQQFSEFIAHSLPRAVSNHRVYLFISLIILS
jgi:hypothetical protein